MLWVLIRIASMRWFICQYPQRMFRLHEAIGILISTHNMFLWRTEENHPSFIIKYLPYEPPLDKTNKMTVCSAKTQICSVWTESLLLAWRKLGSLATRWVHSEDSDQTGQMPRLIRVFAVRMKKAWFLSYPLSAQWWLIRLGRCPDWSDSSLGAHAILLV